MSNDLKKQLIKLGSTNPELRPHIRPVLTKIASRENIVPTILSLRVGDHVEVTTKRYGKRVVSITDNPKKLGTGNIYVYVSSGITRKNNPEGGSLTLYTAKPDERHEGGYHPYFQPTMTQSIEWILDLKKVSKPSKLSNFRGQSQSGGNPKTLEDRKAADSIKKALEKVGLWKGNRWDYFKMSQGGVDPSATVGYSTYDMVLFPNSTIPSMRKEDYFSMGIQTFGNDVGDVTITHSGGEYEYFPNLNAAQRWLQQNFSGSIRNAGSRDFSVGDVVLYGSSKAVVVAFVAFGDMVIKLERGKEVIAAPEQLILVKKA